MAVFQSFFAAAFALAIGLGGVGFAAVWVSQTVLPSRSAASMPPVAPSSHSAGSSSHKRSPGRTISASPPDEFPRTAEEIDTAGPPTLETPSAAARQPAGAPSSTTSPGSHDSRTRSRPSSTAAVMASPANGSSESQPTSGAVEPSAAPREIRGPVLAPPESARPDWTLEEVRVLHEADRALRSGNPVMALRLVDELASRLPGGRLGEEREAVRVLATCASAPGARAQADAASFLRLHKESMYAERITETCKLDSSRRDGSH